MTTLFKQPDYETAFHKVI